MTFLVLEEVTVPRINSIRFRGNAEIGIPIGDVLSKIVRAIRFIGQHGSFIRLQINVIQNIFRNDRIMDIPGGKLDVNRFSQCVHHCMDLGISTAASDSNALVFLESLALSIAFWGSFGGFRISLFLHLHLLYGL